MRVKFVYGGPSDEHDVSILSYQNIFKNATKINGLQFESEYLPKDKKVNLKLDKKTIYWPIIHGCYGEDGQIQKIFERKKVKFVGNSSISSALSFDKYKTGKVLEMFGIKSPRTFLLNKLSDKILEKIKEFNFLIFVKPNKNGSSVGLLKIDDKSCLEKKLQVHLKKYGSILVQEFVDGREFTCGVIRNGRKYIPLVPTEVVLEKNEIFDYKNKYYSKKQIEFTPPENLDKKTIKNIQVLALKCHKVLGLRDFSRTDMILSALGELVVIEVNSVPGMTENSFVPKQLDSKGISTQRFIKMMLKNYS